MKLFLKCLLIELGLSLWIGLAWLWAGHRGWVEGLEWAVFWLGLVLACGLGALALGMKAWLMHSKTAKPIQRGMLAVVLSMSLRAFALVGGLIWAVKVKQAPGAFLLGFLCVYAMQLVLEICYLVLEQKQQSLSQRENG
ncbi:MAG: hypothetical protein FWC28_01385 [Proteobacteria bacterium]|nr:hypothetical protein [Cystobacterineae bacterium]MCL2258576.1 hypothetical protein [Cystobacterineae bacterium]MCL2313892.1 hypothetical protein [Pseudomonadota bacterium]